MQDIQEVFSRVEKAKMEMKDLKVAYKDALETSLEYKEISDKLKDLREKKKQIETTIKEQFSSELTKIDDLKIDIASDMELISDIAMTKIMKGETVEVSDKYENQYEPIFSVKFKKAS
ncbi:MAG: hypothetical protein ABII02_03835 [Candidatus Magasanikbacteria bacterium]